MRIGLIGAGKIGALRAETVKNNADADLVAVFDTSEEAANKVSAGTNAKVRATLDSFLDVPMDAVIISTHPSMHEVAAIAAFARGIHVLCEKPLSNSVEAAKRMVDASLFSKCVLGVGFNMRYYPCMKYVREIIDAGAIGKVDHIRIFGGHGGLHNFGGEWEYKMPESGGGAMMDIGIHMSDIARYFLGEIVEVAGVATENMYHLDGSEDNAIAVFRNPNGIPASYQATWSEWCGYESSIEVYGDKGMVRGAYAPMQNTLVLRSGPNGEVRRTKRRYIDVVLREKLQSWKSTALKSFQEELRDFLRMLDGDTGVPLADGFDGLRAMEVARAVRESSATSTLIKLPNIGRMAVHRK